MGFNSYMASLMMEVTLCAKEVELGVAGETNGTDETRDQDAVEDGGPTAETGDGEKILGSF